MSKVVYNAFYDNATAAITGAINNALVSTGIVAKNDAVKLAPVDNGFLRQSIDYEVEEDRVLIGSTAGYSIYVEKGTGIYAEDGKGRKTAWVYYDSVKKKYFSTRGQKPQPFIQPAVMNNQGEIIKFFEKELKKLDTESENVNL